MTYRKDSNVLYTYGKMIPITTEAIKAHSEGKWLPFDPTSNPLFSKVSKDKDIGWMVSHCTVCSEPKAGRYLENQRI